MINQAGDMGILLGSNTEINLKTAIDAREAQGEEDGSTSTVVDNKMCVCLCALGQCLRACACV